MLASQFTPCDCLDRSGISMDISLYPLSYLSTNEQHVPLDFRALDYV